MIQQKDKIELFKPYLQGKDNYQGGKSKDEVASNGKKIYKLSSNENMLGSSPLAIAAIQKHITGLNEYPDRTDTRYRQALSNFYNAQLQPNQFITANSGVEILELIVRAFLNEGLECIVSNPAFGPYQMFSHKQGAKVIDIPLKGRNFDMDVEGILDAISDRTRLIFITSPNNPTGTHIPKAQIDALVNALPEHVVLVFDEVYFQFAEAGDYVRALPYILEGHKVIAVNSFSKAYGLAGMRMGYAYSNLEIATYVQQVRRPFMINTLCMEAAIAALQDEVFIEKTVHLIHKEKAFIYPQLDALGVNYWKTQANFFMLKPEMPASQFEELMLKEGIMVRPVANFGAPGCIRVTIGTREANQAFLGALRKIISEK